MIRAFLFLATFSFGVQSYSSDLIKYYDGKLKLSPAELDSLCQQVILSKPNDYLVSLAHYQTAILLRRDKQNFKAYEAYGKALHHLNQSDTLDNYLEFNIHRNQGVILKHQGFPKEAASKHEEALPYAYAYKLAAGLSVKYNLGWCLTSHDPERALTIFLEVLEEADEAGLKDRQSKTYNEIADMFVEAGEYGEARGYFEKALALAETAYTKAQSYHNLSSTFYYLEEYTTQESLLLKSLALRAEKDRFPSLRDLGECYLKQEMYAKASAVLREAETYYESYPLTAINIRVFEWLANTEPDSVKYWKRLAAEFERLATEKEKLETLLKQQAMQQLLFRLEVEKQSKNQIGLYRILTISAAVLALAILLTWRIWWYQLRKRLGKKILKLMDKWEEENRSEK